MDKDFYKIYFAGALFTLKDMMGNAALAEQIHKISGGKFYCELPQNFEQRKSDPLSIRNADIESLLSCDIALFNYDGTELDSGTVVEFMFAKFADIPSLIVRTDFRGGGDCDGTEFLPWNLMTSFYPRTEILILNAASLYKKHSVNLASSDGARSFEIFGGKAAEASIEETAKLAVEKLEALLKLPPRLVGAQRDEVFNWIKKSYKKDI